MTRTGRIVPLLLPVLLACGGVAASSGGGRSGADAPAQAANAPATAGPRHTEADIQFMSGMIAHHGQALEMARLVPDRTSTRSIHLLAERIEVSQQDEIAMMNRWLERRGAAARPAGHHDHADGHAAPMAGMLSAEQMARLAAASGPAFDRLFLELMIEHHRGALLMVGELYATPGSGQEVDVNRIASEIDSDQRIEIERMERMLAMMG